LYFSINFHRRPETRQVFRHSYFIHQLLTTTKHTVNTSLSFLDPREMEYWNSIRGWLLLPAAESLHKFAKLAPAEGMAVESPPFASAKGSGFRSGT
jgi:hypothetical protein